LTEEQLLMKKSAYWVYLGGAPQSSKATGQTIYLPKSNLLTVDSLKEILKLSVHDNLPSYQTP